MHEQDTASVDVLGAVSTRPAIPSTAFSKANVPVGGGPVSGPDPGGPRYAITSISAFNHDDSITAVVGLLVYYGTMTDCQTFAEERTFKRGPRFLVPPGDTREITFRQPFVIEPNAGANTCLVVSGFLGAGSEVVANVVGYWF